jgi:addiction module HigA family antidote
MSKLEIAPIHPGEVLKELYLNEINMSAGRLAKELNVPRTRIERVADCSQALSPDTAIRLAKFFNTTPQFWLNLQTNYDVGTAEQNVDVSGIRTFEAAE